MDQVTLFNAHGTFTTTTSGLDRVISKYLPNSPNGLRELLQERTGNDYGDVRDVSAFLVMLADMDYPPGICDPTFGTGYDATKP